MSEFPRRFDGLRVLPLVPGFLPHDLVRSDSVVPIGLDMHHRLILAVLESCNDETLDKVRFVANRDLDVVVVSREAMQYAIERYLLALETEE